MGTDALGENGAAFCHRPNCPEVFACFRAAFPPLETAFPTGNASWKRGMARGKGGKGPFPIHRFPFPRGNVHRKVFEIIGALGNEAFSTGNASRSGEKKHSPWGMAPRSWGMSR